MQGSGDGVRIFDIQASCLELVEEVEEILADEQTFKPSHVKSLKATLVIFLAHLRQFDAYLSEISVNASSKRESALNQHEFYKSKELIAAYENTISALRDLEMLLRELKVQSGLSRFFSSLSLRKQFDERSSQLTEAMQRLVERQTETRQYEHRIFGRSIDDLINKQKDSESANKVPLVLNYLTETIIALEGMKLEGLFRISAAEKQLVDLKSKVELTDCHWRPGPHENAHMYAGLLKLWLRQLPEPVIPYAFYERALAASKDPKATVALVAELPKNHLRVLEFLIKFLQDPILPAEKVTRMDATNLSLIFGASLLRSPDDDPMKEMNNMPLQSSFVKALLEHMAKGSKRKGSKRLPPPPSIVQRDRSTPERLFWSQFPGSLQVPWKEFEGAFVEYLTRGALSESDSKLLRYVLDSSNTGFVTVHKYDEFVKGFGPLEHTLINIKLLFSKPWWHGYLSSEEAGFLLTGSPPGTFLARMSVSNPGSFAIAFVNKEGIVEHSLVKSARSNALSQGRGLYLPLGDGRAIVFSNFVNLIESNKFSFLTTPYDSDFVRENFFHGMLTKDEAEALLHRTTAGTFLVRCSQSSPDCLAVAEQTPGGIVHSLIKRVKGQYTLRGDEFYPTVRDVIKQVYNNARFPCSNPRASMYGIVNNIKSLPAPPQQSNKSEGQIIYLSVLNEETPSPSSAPSSGPTTDTIYMRPSDLLAPGLTLPPSKDNKGKQSKGGGGGGGGAKKEDWYVDVATMLEMSPDAKMAAVPEDVYSMYERVVGSEQQLRRSNPRPKPPSRPAPRLRTQSEGGDNAPPKVSPAKGPSPRAHHAHSDPRPPTKAPSQPVTRTNTTTKPPPQQPQHAHRTTPAVSGGGGAPPPGRPTGAWRPSAPSPSRPTNPGAPGLPRQPVTGATPQQQPPPAGRGFRSNEPAKLAPRPIRRN